MSNNFRNIFLLALFLNVICASQAQENWNEVKNKEGIQVFTRTNTVMSFKEFKATMTIDGKVNDVLSVLFDVEGLTIWGHNISKSELIERDGDSLQIYYAVAKAPWPYIKPKFTAFARRLISSVTSSIGTLNTLEAVAE